MNAGTAEKIAVLENLISVTVSIREITSVPDQAIEAAEWEKQFLVRRAELSGDTGQGRLSRVGRRQAGLRNQRASRQRTSGKQ